MIYYQNDESDIEKYIICNNENNPKCPVVSLSIFKYFNKSFILLTFK